MCDAIGHPVTQLKRVAIGPIRDPRLRLGAWRELSEREVDLLRAAAASTSPGNGTTEDTKNTKEIKTGAKPG
jgi:23S rRNA pseudouridine2605 synthase